MAEQHNAEFDPELLYHIAEGRNAEALSMLNPKLARAYENGWTLLHEAAESDNAVIARKLIDLGAEVDRLNEFGKTPLVIAVEFRYSKTVKVLLEANANMTVVHDGESVLQMALNLEAEQEDAAIFAAFAQALQIGKCPSERVAQKLIDAGCNIFHAAALGSNDLLKCMIDRGIDINSRSSVGMTAMHMAAELDDLNLVQWLLEYGADVNAADLDGYNALWIATYKRNINMVKLLLANGADPNWMYEIDDETPLIVIFSVFQDGCDELNELVKLFLERGAIPRNSNKNGQTIFDYALDRSMDEAIEIVICHMAILEKLGTSITESVMVCKIEKNRSKLFKLQNYYEQCLGLLKSTVFEKRSLFDLLQSNDIEMKVLVRKETFLSKVEQVCSEHKIRELYSYYYGILKKRIDKAKHVVELEDETILAICRLLNLSYNQGYIFARKLVGYLNQEEQQQLVKILL